MCRQRFALSVLTIAVLVLSTVASLVPVGAPLTGVQSQEATPDELAARLPDRTYLGEVYDAVVLQEYLDLQYEALEATVRQLEASGFGDALDSVIDAVLASGRFVFLYFYAEWCHFCQQERPIIDALESAFADTIVFIRVDGERNPAAKTEFAVAGYPTMHLVYGRDAQGYQHADFVGYTPQARLEDALDYVLAHRTTPPRDEVDLLAALESLLTEWPHHTCDEDSCLSDCRFSEGMYEELTRVLYELLRFIGECTLCASAVGSCLGVCSTALTACVGTVGAACVPGLALCAGCFALIAAAEFAPGPSCTGCVDDLFQLIDASRELRETLEECDECCGDPMACEFGVQECKDPDVTGLPDADRCVGNNVVSMTCQECEWEAGPGSTVSPCPEGSSCVETGMTIAECREDDEDDDDDDCTGSDCRDDEDGDGGDDGDRDGRGPSSGPGGDHPDDNEILADPETTTPDLPLTIPEVAVLRRGYYDGATTLLASIGEVTTLLDFSFPQDLAAQYPVLVIPSGGLYGLGQSSLFKAKLEAYVAEGGTLIALSQQYGDDYHALPGAFDGFGWIEDQSCQSRSVAMSMYHPVLSGFTSLSESQSTLDLRVDGFFTAWPDKAQILLTRVKNGQPAVVRFPYGNGQVIATTLFTDYNTLVWFMLTTPDERVFLRDLITWAKHPQPMTSFAPGTLMEIPLNLTSSVYDATFYPASLDGDTIEVTVSVTNNGSEPLNRISFRLLDPTFQVHVVNVSAMLAPNETRAIPITFTATGSPPEGVWYVLYGLYTDDHLIWSGLAAFTLHVDLEALSTYTVVFTLLNPDGHVVERRNVTAYVDAMATRPLNFSYTPTELGIWAVDYVVYNYRDVIVDFGVTPFAVSYYQSHPLGWTYQDSELVFTVTSDQEYYLWGTPANFTFHLWNNGDTAQNVTVTWGVHHHSYYGVVPLGIYDAFTTWIVVPASGYASFNYTLPTVVDVGGDRFRAKFYVDGSCVGTVEKGFYAYSHVDGSYIRTLIDFDMTTDQDAYRSGNTVAILINATSRLDFTYDTRLFLRVARLGARGREGYLWNTTFDALILNASHAAWRFNFTLPLPAQDDTYHVTLLVGNWIWATAWFTVLPYEVDITVDLPTVFSPHTSATGVLTLNNTGDQDLGNGTITVAFLNPDPHVQWNATTTFTVLAVNQTTTLPFTIPITNVHLGTYQLTYHITFDPHKTVEGTLDLSSSLVVDLAFDRAAYRAREEVGITVDVANDGVFVQNRSLRLDVPDIGYTGTWDLLVPPGDTQRVAVAIPLPSNISVGVHDLHLALQDDGNWTSRTYRFAVPESRLRVTLTEARYDASEDALIDLRNVGGIDTTVEYAITLIGPSGLITPTLLDTVPIQAGASVAVIYPIPTSLLTGPYELQVETWNARTNATRTTRLPLWVDGVSVDMAVATDRDVYGPSDTVEVTSHLTNTGAYFENGTLHLDIVAALPHVTAANWTTYVTPPIGTVDVIAFDDDGNAWLGGYGRVVRYRDGEWDAYTAADGLPGSYMRSLIIDAAGRVWVGADYTPTSLSVFDGFEWTRLNETTTGIAFNFTAALAVGPDGDVWVGSRAGGGLHRFNGTHWTTYTMATSGMVSDRVACLAVDAAGTVWIGGGQWDEYGVTAFNGTHWTTYTYANTYPGLKNDRVDAIAVDHDGQVWFGHDEYLYGGISVFNGTHWTTYTRSASQLPDYRVQTLAVDADGQVWAGTRYGVAVFDGATWTTYTTDTSGLEANDVETFGVDAAGQVWVGYDDFSGVSIFNGSHFTRLVPSIIDDRVYDVLVDASGVVWFATYGGISRYDGDAWTSLTAKNSGLLSDVVYVLDVDPEGHLWAGTLAGISTYNGTGWTSYDESTTGLDLSSTDAFSADPYGNLWFASNRLIGTFRFNGTHWAAFNTTTSGLASDDVRALLVDAYGDLWIATDRGVNWYNGSHWRLYNASHSALGDDDVMDLALDAQNRVWIAHRRGVDVFDRTAWTAIDPQVFAALEVGLGFSRITVDPHDGVWVGAWWMGTTGGRGYGVLFYDGYTWVKYNGTSGLPSHFVNAIAFDQDHVWFGSNRGASVLATEAQAPSPVLWHSNRTLTLPESTANTTRIDVDPLGVTGKLYLRGHLFTANGLVVASDLYPFYVVDGDLLLTYDLDAPVYAVGETVTLTGSLRNLDATQAYDGLTVTLRSGATVVYQASVDLPANGTHPLATSFVAASTGEHTLEATVIQAGATLLTVLDRYTAAEPSVVVDVAAPTIVGFDPFPVTVRVNNTGVTEASVTVNGTTVTLEPGAVRFLELTRQVDRNTTYALVVTGDYEATLHVNVVLGAAATVTLTPAPMYLEGFVAIPYAIINTGSLDLNATVTFTLDGVSEERDVYVTAMQTLTGQLLYNLTEGAYALSYSSLFDGGQVDVTVVTPNQIDVMIHDTERINGTLQVPITVTNVGVNDIAGTIRISSDIASLENPLTLPTGTSQEVVWNVSLRGVQAGTYNVTLHVQAADEALHEGHFTVHVTPHHFVLVDVPVNASYPWGALANMTITVRNEGDSAGDAEVTLTVPGILETTQAAWILPDETTQYNFTVPIPDDLAAGWYPVLVALNGERHQTALYVYGANVSVTASVDRMLYAEGVNATVTLRVANRNGLNLSLVATVRSDAYEALVPFNLSSGDTTILTFNVPVLVEGGSSQTVVYTVSLASGRALYIDALRLTSQPPPASGIALYTDQQVYAIGDTVTVTVNASWAGVLNATAPSFHVEEALDAGPRVYTFTVPPLLSGTYAVEYAFDGNVGLYPFDVDGYAARIVALTLDKTVYAVGEAVRLEMEVEARRAFEALLRVTVYDQLVVPIDRYSVNVSLVAGLNRVEVTRLIPIGGLGLYAINPRIYVDLPAHSYVLVTSGARFFDVIADDVAPILVIRSPEDTTYPTGTIWLNVTPNEDVAWMGYSLDGGLNVTMTEHRALIGATHGAHVVTVYASDPSGNLGASTVAFSVTIDVTAPHIVHTPVTSAIDDQPITLTALVTDDAVVVAVALYYRQVGATSYTRLPMPLCATCIDTYNATIPAFWKAVDVEYYLNATDGVQVALDGTSASPYTITVLRSPAAVTLSPLIGATHDALTLSWTPSDDADFANYTVFLSTAPGTLGTSIAVLTDASTTTYTVTGLAPATTYHFTVRVTDADGRATDSPSVSATTTTAPPPAEIPWLYVILALVAIAVVVVSLVVRNRLG